MTKEASAKTTLEVTILYDEMVQWLCRQYLKVQKHMTTCSMTRNALRKHCEKELEFLENVAFYVIKDSRVIIDSNVFDEVEKAMGWFINDYPQVLNIGILKSFNDKRIGSHVDVKKPHYVVHLSFQEFFAAGYIVTGLRSDRSEDSINFIKANKYDQRFRLLLNFVSGLLTLYNEKQPIQYFWDAILNEPLDLFGLRYFDLIISCLEETRGSSNLNIENFPDVHTTSNALTKLLEHISHDVVLQRLLTVLKPQHNSELREQVSTILKNTPENHVIYAPIHMVVLATEDKNIYHRQIAYAVLQHVGGKAATQEMIKGLLIALSDKNDVVRVYARRALERLDERAANEEVIKVLLAALSDQDCDVRACACKALGQIDGKRGDVHIMNALVDLSLRSSVGYYFLWKHLKNALYHSETMIILKSDIVRNLEISLGQCRFQEFLAIPTHKFVNVLLKTVDVSWMPIVTRTALYQRNAIVVWNNSIWVYGSEEPKKSNCSDKMQNELVEAFFKQGKELNCAVK
ncbi:unnamed protein product [Rotaria magnacalcarata]|uniref:HEAT repeat domain-containing protein n=1 Tax=Rotaria magnacalcarata TaxID=392030 RepID=A0A816ZQU6_9BILA|nr:unnamed protein product [Rotaria magnacalcarata]